MKNFNILSVHWKIQILGGGEGGEFSQKTDIEGGIALKKKKKKKGGGVGQFGDLRGATLWLMSLLHCCLDIQVTENI